MFLTGCACVPIDTRSTHFAWDQVLHGVRYVQAALAYPEERRSRWHTLQVGRDDERAFGADGPLLIWSASCGFAPKRHCRWSGFYEVHAREPLRVSELAAYAARQFARTDASRAVECMPDFSHEGAAGSVGLRMRARDPVLPV